MKLIFTKQRKYGCPLLEIFCQTCFLVCLGADLVYEMEQHTFVSRVSLISENYFKTLR